MKWQSGSVEAVESAAVSGRDLGDGGDDVGEVGFGKVVMHGEREDLLSQGEGDRGVVLVEAGKGGLLREGAGIVHGGGNTFGHEGLGELIARDGETCRVDLDDVEVVHTPGAGGLFKGSDAGKIAEGGIETHGILLTLRGLGLEAIELGAADGSGDVVHAVVVPDALVEILVGLAVGAEEFDAAGEGIVVAGDEAAFAGAEVLGGVEGVGDGITESADGLVFVLGEMGLRGVVDDLEVVGFSEGMDGIDIDDLAVEVGGGDGLGLLGDLSGGIGDINLGGAGDGIDEDGSAAAGDDHGDGGDIGPGGDEDFVAGIEEGLVGELEGAGAVGAGHGVLGPGHGTEAALEFIALGGGAEHAGVEDADGGADVGIGEAGGHEGDGGLGDGGAAIDGQAVVSGWSGDGDGSVGGGCGGQSEPPC